MFQNYISFILVIGLLMNCQNPNSSSSSDSADDTQLEMPYSVVAENGSDQNPGTLSRPFATVGKALQGAKPGHTIYIRGGAYAQQTTIQTSGMPDAWIAIRNYPDEVPIFDGGWRYGNDDGLDAAFFGGTSAYITIQGLVMHAYKRAAIDLGWNGDKTVQTHDYQIRYCLVDQCGQKGISASFCQNVIYEYNIVSRTGHYEAYGSWSSGLNFYEMHGVDNVMRGNVSFHHVDFSDAHTDGNGMILDISYDFGGATFENNICFENGGSGLAITESANTTILNNTFYNNDRSPSQRANSSGLGYWGDIAMTRTIVVNNISIQPDNNGITTGPGIEFTNSYLMNNFSSGVNEGEPGFINAAQANFALTDTSVCIDAGHSGYHSVFSIGYDYLVIKRETGQDVSWWRFAPDIEYVISKGGLEQCFHPVQRPQGVAVDIGAFEGS